MEHKKQKNKASRNLVIKKIEHMDWSLSKTVSELQKLEKQSTTTGF